MEKQFKRGEKRRKEKSKAKVYHNEMYGTPAPHILRCF
jgi:hypothetical protein